MLISKRDHFKKKLTISTMIHHIFPSSPRFFRGIFNSISAPRQEGIIQKDLGEKNGFK